MNNKSRSAVRIIAGKWRRRKIYFTASPSLRPTQDRLRETVFNWLAPYLQGARCLDCFAGTGAFGFEALSRGAAHLTLIDQDNEAIDHLQSTAKLLDANDACDIVLSDTKSFLSSYHGPKFDLFFLDPPFYHELLIPTCQLLLEHQLLSDDTIIYIESEKQLDLTPLDTDFDLYRSKTTKTIHYGLLHIKA